MNFAPVMGRLIASLTEPHKWGVGLAKKHGTFSSYLWGSVRGGDQPPYCYSTALMNIAANKSTEYYQIDRNWLGTTIQLKLSDGL